MTSAMRFRSVISPAKYNDESKLDPGLPKLWQVDLCPVGPRRKF